ncbi:MAG: prepilin-type N-terminal cleavage/methylation domain-containing protein [Candidatus Omnitrophica bacterium]|nr:prepilin-type N-terminal cleavage/methylation domain-containing protein [Candidatus Omnitrophota bacterium]
MDIKTGKGFTLLELLVAMVMFSMVVLAASSLYSNMLKLQKISVRSSFNPQKIQAVLNKMEKDVNNSAWIKVVSSNEIDLYTQSEDLIKKYIYDPSAGTLSFADSSGTTALLLSHISLFTDTGVFFTAVGDHKPCPDSSSALRYRTVKVSFWDSTDDTRFEDADCFVIKDRYFTAKQDWDITYVDADSAAGTVGHIGTMTNPSTAFTDTINNLESITGEECVYFVDGSYSLSGTVSVLSEGERNILTGSNASVTFASGTTLVLEKATDLYFRGDATFSTYLSIYGTEETRTETIGGVAYTGTAYRKDWNVYFGNKGNYQSSDYDYFYFNYCYFYGPEHGILINSPRFPRTSTNPFFVYIYYSEASCAKNSMFDITNPFMCYVYSNIFKYSQEYMIKYTSDQDTRLYSSYGNYIYFYATDNEFYDGRKALDVYTDTLSTVTAEMYIQSNDFNKTNGADSPLLGGETDNSYLARLRIYGGNAGQTTISGNSVKGYPNLDKSDGGYVRAFWIEHVDEADPGYIKKISIFDNTVYGNYYMRNYAVSDTSADHKDNRLFTDGVLLGDADETKTEDVKVSSLKIYGNIFCDISSANLDSGKNAALYLDGVYMAPYSYEDGWSTQTIVEPSYIYGNYFVNNCEGIHIERPNDTELSDSYIYHNILCRKGDVTVNDGKNYQGIRFYSNTLDGVNLFENYAPEKWFIYSVIIWGADAGLDTALEPYTYYSDIMSMAAPISPNIRQDPMFAGTAAYDYRLLPGSPCDMTGYNYSEDMGAYNNWNGASDDTENPDAKPYL